MNSSYVSLGSIRCWYVGERNELVLVVGAEVWPRIAAQILEEN